ncbi:uncharacterized protein LOC135397234 [Ornithodoros turicata]|uniref:uncharacterized protein LOC135397234 n=1 Tax=Ornithodoros turicata TaxID=34597 RepID=UPI00313A00D0
MTIILAGSDTGETSDEAEEKDKYEGYAPRPLMPRPKTTPPPIPTKTSTKARITTTTTRTTTSTTTTTATPTTTGTIPHYFIKCTVGEMFKYDDSYKSANCDYFIFDSVIPTASGLIGSEDQHAWMAFNSMTWTGSPKPELGVSFPGSDVDQLTAAISQTVALSALKNLFTKGFRLFGVLNCFGTASLLSSSRSAFEGLFDKILSSMGAPQRGARGAFFIGLHLSAGSTAQSASLMQYATAIKHLDVLILQTHITPPPAVNASDCFIYPTSSWSQTPIENGTYSSVQRAAQMLSAAPNTNLSFGISFSMRVNIYELPTEATTSSAAAKQACASRNYGDLNSMCGPSAYSTFLQDDDCINIDFIIGKKFAYTFSNQPCINVLYDMARKEVQKSSKFGVLLADINMDTAECIHWERRETLWRVTEASNLLRTLRRDYP